MRTKIILALLLALILLALTVQTGSTVALAQTPVCRPYVYETIPGLVPVGSRVRFEVYENGALRERQGTIIAYYWRPCWPGAPVMGLEDSAYNINYEHYGPSGLRIDILLNRNRFEVLP